MHNRCDAYPRIGDIICAIKSIATKIVKKHEGIIEWIIALKIRQFRFHDHIIRNELEYQKIWQYIDENLPKWERIFFHSKHFYD